ncbi:hypothetical protein SAMN05421810_102264 [Amycolatopsis arida]|uniref:SMI1-KNR4 cell-wall n=1 Tax=Amycolatopsis arida TaxID=587909 RepID=A0A1I5PGA3_9PSEU|nr:SMI1/KNR4 family protein [Amycolatopsis arida]TDX98472.1 hypothetical protein CLV69_101264 [Amycolatopsis arida]SFP32526.1 hypothetical protein SAMN05421810_102264 [Amycolatopsis arida]
MPDTVDDVVEHLVSLGLAAREDLVPCSATEIEEIRAVQRVPALPGQYVDFLRTMGRSAGRFLRGSDFFYPQLVELVEEARDLLAENDVAHLMLPGSVVVGLHQGYQVYWMEPGEPSGRVHWYDEGEESVTRSWPSLVDFLVAQADEQKRVIDTYRL